MKNKLLKHIQNLVPWVRIYLSDPIDGTKEFTLEYEDSFEFYRERYYKFSDEEFLLIQLAISAIVLIYHENVVGYIGSKDDPGAAIVGNDFIQILNAMNEMRKGSGDTYMRLEETFKTLRRIVNDVDKQKDIGKTNLRKKEEVARHFWNKALATVKDKLKTYQKHAKKRKL